MSLSRVYCEDSLVPHSILVTQLVNIQSDEEKAQCKVKDSGQSETEQRDLAEDTNLGASVQCIAILDVVLGARISHCGRRLFFISVVS